MLYKAILNNIVSKKKLNNKLMINHKTNCSKLVLFIKDHNNYGVFINNIKNKVIQAII